MKTKDILNQSKYHQLAKQLEEKPELVKNLSQALSCKKYIITITRKQIKDPAHPELDLQHFWVTNEISIVDAINSLKFIEKDFCKHSNVKQEEEWH